MSTKRISPQSKTLESRKNWLWQPIPVPLGALWLILALLILKMTPWVEQVWLR